MEGINSKRTTWEVEGVVQKETPPYPYPVYLSPQRDSALLLCGWSFAGAGHGLEDFIKREEMSERYERAAAVSVFRGNMRRGILTLTDGATLARQQGNEERGKRRWRKSHFLAEFHLVMWFVSVELGTETLEGYLKRFRNSSFGRLEAL